MTPEKAVATKVLSPQKINNTVLEIPPLENGDRLTRIEFERRYEAMPHIKKAELIERVVYIQTSVRAKSHGEPHAKIVGWLGNYCAATPGVDIADSATVRLDWDNEPQPDALLRIDVGGQSVISDDDYVEGAPELIVEIAASTASYDLHDKLKVYRRNGAQEYLVWRVYNKQLDWFKLSEGEYIPLEPNADGVICSQIFPGLWLAISALLEGNLAEVLAVLQKGLETDEHQEFVQRLSASEQ